MAEAGRVGGYKLNQGGRWIEWLAAAGARPDDTAEQRLHKAILTFVAGLGISAGALWGALYLALGLPLAAAIPLGHAVVTGLSLVYFVCTKRYAAFRWSQLCLILALPALLQWSLGGFAGSGAVILWALFSPLGALLFEGMRRSVPWFVAFVALIGVSGLLDPWLMRLPARLPPAVATGFFVLNVAAVSAAAYALVGYFALRVREEHERAESLLRNVLPQPIAERLKRDRGAIADAFPEATVLFADIVDFTPRSATMTAEAVVALLNEVFSLFDGLAAQRGLEKIKTIGDAYMVAGGVPHPRPDHAEAIAELALDIQDALAERAERTGDPLAVRIGINTGLVVAGVIGTTKFSYDVWGDAVNTASRMETQGVPAHIQVTEATYERLREQYVFEERGLVEVKGKGAMRVYLLAGRRDGTRRSSLGTIQGRQTVPRPARLGAPDASTSQTATIDVGQFRR